MSFNVPVWLTFLRMLLIPFFIIAFYLPFCWAPAATTIVFIAAAITDWADGFLARRWSQVTQFGTFLDPVVDKVMVIVALVLLTDYFHAWYITLPAIIIVIREIVVSSLRQWMAILGKHDTVSVSWIAKIKTVSQMMALSVLLYRADGMANIAGISILQVSAFLTLWSMFNYLHRIYYKFCGEQQ